MVSINPERGPAPGSRRERRERSAADRRRSGPPSGMPPNRPPSARSAPVTVAAPQAGSAGSLGALGARTALPDAPGRAVRAPRPRRSFGPVSVSLLVGLQVLALTAVLARMSTTPGHVALLGLLGGAGLLLAVPTRSGSLGTVVLRRLSFATRSRVVGAQASQGDPLGAAGGEVASGEPAPPESAAMPVGALGVSLYPGLVLRTVRDLRGRSLGVAEWSQAVTAVVAVSDLAGAPVRPDVRHRVPLTAIHDRLRSGDIPVDAFSVHVVIPASGLPSRAAGPWWRGRRDVFVSVRVRPLRAREAIARRGGGRRGVEACMAALTSALEAEVRAAGLAAQTLDADGLRRAIDVVAAPFPTAAHGRTSPGELTPWTEGWSQVTGAAGVHRSLVCSGWRRCDAVGHDRFLDLAGDAAAGVSVGVEVRLDPGEGGAVNEHSAPVRLTVRVSAAGAQDASEAAERVVAAAASEGLDLSHAVGDELTALRASGLLGDGVSTWFEDGAALHPVAAARLPIASEELDGLAPSAGGGVLLGHDGDGAVAVLDLVRAQPQRIVTLGEGWLAGVLVGRAARCGVRVVVATDRSAPWQVLIRQLGVEDAVTLVSSDARTLPGDGDPGARLVVVAGAGINPPGARQPWQTILTVLAGAAGEGGVIAAADVLLVTKSAVTDDLVRQLGLGPQAQARLVGLSEFDVAALAGGHVNVVRVDPNASAS